MKRSILFFLLLGIVPIVECYSQSTELGNGVSPIAVSVDPIQGIAFVANGGGTISVITLETGAVTELSVGGSPSGLALDPAAGKLIILDRSLGAIRVLDTGDFSFVTLYPQGFSAGQTTNPTFTDPALLPSEVAIAPALSLAFVANENGFLTTLDTRSQTLLRHELVGTSLTGVAVNSATSEVYVADQTGASGRLFVLDALNSNLLSTVTLTGIPVSVGVDPGSNRVFVAMDIASDPDKVAVVDGNSGYGLREVSIGSGVTHVSVDPVSGFAYLSHSTIASVWKVDPGPPTPIASSLASFSPGDDAAAMVYNPVTGRLAVALRGAPGVILVRASDGDKSALISTGPAPVALSFNQTTGEVITANSGANATGNGASIINANFASFDVDGTGVLEDTPINAAVSLSTGKAYVLNFASNTISVVDKDGVIREAPIDVGTLCDQPTSAAFDDLAGRLYVTCSGSGGILVLTPRGPSMYDQSFVAVGSGPTPMAFASASRTLFVGLRGTLPDTVIKLDACPQSVGGQCTDPVVVGTPVSVGDLPAYIQINQTNGRVYVSNTSFSTDGELTVIDGTSLNVINRVALPRFPQGVALDERTNRVYVTRTLDSQVSEFDQDGNLLRTLTDFGGQLPRGLAVDSEGARLFSANFAGSVSVLDLTSGSRIVDPIPVSDAPFSVLFEPVRNRIVVGSPDGAFTSGSVSIIDGKSYFTHTDGPFSGAPRTTLINSVSGSVYVVVEGNPGTLVVIRDEQADGEIPLQMRISGLPDDLSKTRSLSIEMEVTGTYGPTLPGRNLFYQLDNITVPWLTAFPAGPVASANFTDLSPGSHTLFAFATDGQEATAANVGAGKAPLVGKIESYTFFVTPESDLSLDLTVDNPSPDLLPAREVATFAISVSNDGPEVATNVIIASTIPVGLDYLADNGGTSTATVSDIVTWNLSSLAPQATARLLIQTRPNGSGADADDFTFHSQVTSVVETDPDSTPASAAAPSTINPDEDDEATARIGLGVTINLPAGTTSATATEDPEGYVTFSVTPAGAPGFPIGPIAVDALGLVTINPNEADAVTLSIDPNTIPFLGVQFNGNGDDILAFTETAAVAPNTTASDYQFLGDGSGTVSFLNTPLGAASAVFTAPVTFTGVSTITDELATITDHNLTVADSGGDPIVLSGAAAGESTLDSGFGTVLTFLNPTTLTISGSEGPDTFEINPLIAAFPTDVIVNGGAGNDTFNIVANTGYTTTLNGGEDIGGVGDVVNVTGPVENPVVYDVTGSGAGTVRLGPPTEETFNYTEMEGVTDLLSVADRTFGVSATGGEAIILTDDGTASDGVSQLDTGLDHILVFAHPTSTFNVTGSPGDDEIQVLSIDENFSLPVNVAGEDGNDFFFVVPLDGVIVNVDGGSPTRLPGDALDIDDTANGVLTLTSATSGKYTFPDGRADVVFTNIEATAETDLSITISPDTLYPADVNPITYTVTNNGPNPATGLMLEIPQSLLDALQGLTVETSQGTFLSPFWSIGPLEVGASVTLTLTGFLNSITGFDFAVGISNPPNASENGFGTTPLTVNPGFVLPAKSHPQSLLFTSYEFGGDTFQRALIGLFQGSPGLTGAVYCKIPEPNGSLFTAEGGGPMYRTCAEGLPFPLNVNDLFEDDQGTIWALTWGYAGLYKSLDKGVSWTAASPDTRHGSSTWTNVYAMTQAVDGTLYISTDYGDVFRSFNHGVSWQRVGAVPGNSSGVPWSLEASLDPAEPGVVYAGSFGRGVSVSTDYGFTWSEIANNASLIQDGGGHVFDIEIAPSNPDILFFATAGGVYRYDRSGIGRWTSIGPELELPAGTGKFVRPEMRSIDFDIAGTSLGGASWGLGAFVNTDPLGSGTFLETHLRKGNASLIVANPSGGFSVSVEGGFIQEVSAGSATSTAAQTEWSSIPTDYILDQNYPNPFNPVTTITFAMPESGEARLEVFDLLGRRVRSLVDGPMEAGRHEVAFDARRLPSGTYLYSLSTRAGVFTRTMVLLK